MRLLKVPLVIALLTAFSGCAGVRTMSQTPPITSGELSLIAEFEAIDEAEGEEQEVLGGPKVNCGNGVCVIR